MRVCRAALSYHRYPERPDRAARGRPYEVRSVERRRTPAPCPRHARQRQAAVRVPVRCRQLIGKIGIDRLRRDVGYEGVGVQRDLEGVGIEVEGAVRHPQLEQIEDDPVAGGHLRYTQRRIKRPVTGIRAADGRKSRWHGLKRTVGPAARPIALIGRERKVAAAWCIGQPIVSSSNRHPPDWLRVPAYRRRKGSSLDNDLSRRIIDT